jgi:histidine phosphotransferase ChpT
MNDNELELAQLLCTRLCHDLAGPIGAVAAGVELIGGDPSAADSETLGLIGSSSAAASFKLKFIRAVMGATGGALDMESLLEGYLSATASTDGRPKVRWPAPAAFEPVAAAAGSHWRPALLNLCLATLEMQPGCRELTVAVDEPASLRIEAKGQTMRSTARRDDLEAALCGKTALQDLSAKTVQAFMAGRMVRAAGGTVEVATHDGAVAVVANFNR